MSFKLKELLDEKGYIRGPFGSSLRRNELLDEGIPVYEQQNAIYNNRDFRYYINSEKYEEMKRFTVRENDLIISCSGTVGRISIIKKDDPIGIISKALLILRPNTEKVLTEFLFYFFKSRVGYNSIISRSGGSVQSNISKRAVIENIDIDVPPFEEQKSIAHILSTLDDKIEINNKINDNLEQMAQAIFKQWFVDFEFPNEDGKPYKSSGGEMVESELGVIPKGWIPTTLDKIAILTMGVSPSSTSYNEKQIGLELINGASDFDGKLIKVTKYTSEPKKVCAVGDMVFGVRATIGNTVFADNQYAIGRGVAALKEKNSIYRELIYFYLENSMAKLINNASGSVFLNLKKSDITDLKIIYSKETVMKFHNIVEPIISKIIENDRESESLKRIRDLLIPKLMSGEINLDKLEINI